MARTLSSQKAKCTLSFSAQFSPLLTPRLCLQLDYVVIPESVPSFSLPHLRSLRFYDVRMTGQSLTALMAGCTSLELLRLIDLRDCDFVDLHCPSLKEFVMEETGEVGSVHLDCPKLKRSVR
jgi:hypothetical protein